MKFMANVTHMKITITWHPGMCTHIPLLAGLTVNGSCGSQALIVVMILLAGAVDTTQAIFLLHIT